MHWLLLLQVPGLAEKRPSVLRGDKVFLISNRERRCYESYVHHINKDDIELGLHPRLDYEVAQRYFYSLQ